jgi:hypothetical protein
MKNLTVSIVIFLLIGISVQSCRSTCDRTVFYYSKIPIYQDLASMRENFEVQEAQDMDTILRIVELDNAYFIEEKGKGVHVIDKLNFSVPTRTAFISAPGCLSIEAQDNMLYIARGTDIIEVNVGDIKQITKANTLIDHFNDEYVKNDSFVIGYREEFVERVIEDGDCAESYIYPEQRVTGFVSALEPNADLHITKGHLVGCDNKQAKNFHIGTGGSLRALLANARLNSYGEVEEQKLSSNDQFIVVGKPSGSMISIINNGSFSQSSTPNISSPFTCGAFYMFQDVIFYTDFADQTDINCLSSSMLHVHPLIVGDFAPRRFQFQEPQHISISDSVMLLCDGSGGFGVYDVSNAPSFNPTINKLDEILNVHSKVSVLSKDRAMIWGNDGLFYINVTNPSDIKVIAEIK